MDFRCLWGPFPLCALTTTRQEHTPQPPSHPSKNGLGGGNPWKIPFLVPVSRSWGRPDIREMEVGILPDPDPDPASRPAPSRHEQLKDGVPHDENCEVSLPHDVASAPRAGDFWGAVLPIMFGEAFFICPFPTSPKKAITLKGKTSPPISII